MNIITLNEELLLEGVWDTMKEKFGNDKVAKFRQLKDGNQLPSGGDFEQKKNPQYWNNKTVDEFNEYLNNAIEGNFYNDRQKEDLTSKLRTKLARTINVSAANELARAFWEHRNEIQDQEQRNIKYWIQNQNLGYSDLAAVLQPIQARKSNSAGRYDKVYESDFMIIYKVYDWIAARNLSKGTSWCITGRYSSENGDGSGFFTRYLPHNGKREGSQYHYYYIVHDLTHSITYRGDRIRNHTNNTPQQYCMVINGSGKINEVWEPGDTEIGKIPWIPAEHQVQPIPGVQIPYGDVDDWPEPERVDLAGRADGFTSQFVIENGVLVKCNIQSGTVYIPDSVTKIGNEAFANSAITQVIIPNSVTEIGNNTFWKCIYLKSVTLPNSLAKIGRDAFKQCIRLESITIPDSVTEIPSRAFRNCTLLESIIIPNSVIKIDHSAFSGCTSLKSVIMPSNVTEIAEHTFYNCTALKSITIPSSVTKIGDNAFAYCRTLKSVTIPEGITEIGDHAFSNCHTDLVVNTDNETVITYCARNNINYQRITAQRGEKLQQVDDTTSQFTIENGILTSCDIQSGGVRIPNTVTKIGERAFESSEITQVVIPSSVTEIDVEAFFNCRSLESVIIPDSVTEIGERAFIYCRSLKSITIPDNVTQINPKMFHGCHSLESIVIPDSVTEIRYGAFFNCRSLKNIVIPNSVTGIGSSTFSGCASLRSIVLPDSITYIGDRAFNNCHQDLIVNTDNQFVINYCEQNHIHCRRITPQHINEPQHVDENDFRAAFNMAMRNRVGGH